jgi:hypothetical protein
MLVKLTQSFFHFNSEAPEIEYFQGSLSTFIEKVNKNLSDEIFPFLFHQQTISAISLHRMEQSGCDGKAFQ